MYRPPRALEPAPFAGAALRIYGALLLWRSHLPHGGFATPMTYIPPKSGRQFVVMASSSLYGFGKPDGVVYALAETK